MDRIDRLEERWTWLEETTRKAVGVLARRIERLEEGLDVQARKLEAIVAHINQEESGSEGGEALSSVPTISVSSSEVEDMTMAISAPGTSSLALNYCGADTTEVTTELLPPSAPLATTEESAAVPTDLVPVVDGPMAILARGTWLLATILDLTLNR